MRYRLYREHKYVFYIFNNLLCLVARSDFSNFDDVNMIGSELKNLDLLLQSHAHHENTCIHALLKSKNSSIANSAELEHEKQKHFFNIIYAKLHHVKQESNVTKKTLLGYEIYLDLRQFFAENLIHFDYEERLIMQELQRLFSDDEIREIDSQCYKLMTVEQLVQMMQILFPHMNKDDRSHFLYDIKTCQPEKLVLAWNEIASHIDQAERLDLAELLKI